MLSALALCSCPGGACVPCFGCGGGSGRTRSSSGCGASAFLCRLTLESVSLPLPELYVPPSQSGPKSFVPPAENPNYASPFPKGTQIIRPTKSEPYNYTSHLSEADTFAPVTGLETDGCELASGRYKRRASPVYVRRSCVRHQCAGRGGGRHTDDAHIWIGLGPRVLFGPGSVFLPWLQRRTPWIRLARMGQVTCSGLAQPPQRQLWQWHRLSKWVDCVIAPNCLNRRDITHSRA